MLADLFRTAFRNLVRDMKYQLERSGQKRGINAVAAAIRPGIITDKLNNAIATGNWGRGRVGVTQLLDRTNYLSTISHLEEFNLHLVEHNQTLKQEICMQLTLDEFVQVKLLKVQTVV